jgi:hypothetical protein
VEPWPRAHEDQHGQFRDALSTGRELQNLSDRSTASSIVHSSGQVRAMSRSRPTSASSPHALLKRRELEPHTADSVDAEQRGYQCRVPHAPGPELAEQRLQPVEPPSSASAGSKPAIPVRC